MLTTVLISIDQKPIGRWNRSWGLHTKIRHPAVIYCPACIDSMVKFQIPHFLSKKYLLKICYSCQVTANSSQTLIQFMNINTRSKIQTPKSIHIKHTALKQYSQSGRETDRHRKKERDEKEGKGRNIHVISLVWKRAALYSQMREADALETRAAS